LAADYPSASYQPYPACQSLCSHPPADKPLITLNGCKPADTQCKNGHIIEKIITFYYVFSRKTTIFANGSAERQHLFRMRRSGKPHPGRAYILTPNLGLTETKHKSWL
jgi:hypothetical protein